MGYWATLSLNIPDFTRYARSQRSQALGQALGLPSTMTAFAFIGVAVTSATIVIFGEAICEYAGFVSGVNPPIHGKPWSCEVTLDMGDVIKDVREHQLRPERVVLGDEVAA